MSASASHEAQEWPEREPTPGRMDVNTIREALEKNLKRVYREDDHPTDTTTDKPRKISIRFCLRYREVDEAVFDGIIYRPGMSFELNDDSYLRVETITQRRDHEILFHGLRFFMTTDNRVDAYIPKFRGELVWFTHITDPIPIDEIKRVCRIRITNTRLQEWKDHEHLICRLKFTIRDQHIPPPEQNGQPDREPLGAAETFIEWISPEELDLGYGSSSKELRDAWRGAGNTIPFGAAEVPAGVQSVTSQPPRAIEAESSSSMTIDLTQTIEATQAIDLTSDPDPLDVIDLTVTPRAYTFGDAFCGAGGVSCGAQKAGAAIVWAFDRCPRAMDTYRRNFNAPIMENSDVFDFMTNRESDMRVDVAHCSPPCQPFSPAHTVHNQARDEVNSACIFIASNLVTKARPRILTMEETYGLAQRHKEVFSRMILDLVEIGYSVRWAVLECAHYGVPQWRKRLIILAAGPGETLPEMPEPTHGLPGGGLLRLNTIRRAISGIPDDAPDHDVQRALTRWQLRGYHEPYNGSQPARTVTCNGGEFNYHPDGTRPFTCREFACLQTFPMDFQFSTVLIRRQIGNAVPPIFAEAIYREIFKSLRETDEKELRG